MIAQQDVTLAPWLYGIVNHIPTRSGDFLRSLAEAALRADADNYLILRPALVQLREKYPGYNDPGAWSDIVGGAMP